LAVGLTVAPHDGRLRLTANIVGGNETTGLNLTFRLRTTSGEIEADGVPCGAGCFRTDPRVVGRPRIAFLRIERLGHTPITLRYPFPDRWPPRSATAIARRATEAFDDLHSVVIRERLASSATQVLRTVWMLEEPDRLAYRIAGGSEAVVIGTRRWDRDPGGRWQRSTITTLRQPTAVWGQAPRHAALIGSRRVGGRETWLVSFVDPAIPAWFTVAVEKQTFRPLELRMVAPAHFMHHLYERFNAAAPIKPPAGGFPSEPRGSP
jgi:hypothetical protein